MAATKQKPLWTGPGTVSLVIILAMALTRIDATRGDVRTQPREDLNPFIAALALGRREYATRSVGRGRRGNLSRQVGAATNAARCERAKPCSVIEGRAV